MQDTASEHHDTISIVTVNYRTPALVIDLIESIAAQRNTLPGINMYIVDNASGDHSLGLIAEHLAQKNYHWATLIPSPRNVGFSAGNNLALRKCLEGDGPDFVWLLNPDTQLRPGAGTELLEFVKNNPSVIAGSRLEDADATPQASAFNFPGVISEMCRGFGFGIMDRMFRQWVVVKPVSEVAEPCDWLAGASMLMSTATIRTVGYMDEDYFLYFEEVDYCLQAQRKKIQCWYVPISRVYHAVGASTKISDGRAKRPRIPAYWFDSRRRYFLKNRGAFALLAADILFMIGHSTWYLRKKMLPGAGPEAIKKIPPYYFVDFLRHSALIKGVSLKK
jgi:N-acetylglucosaminyl-diphospho-decaprenol L-rhamnosyltransferase